MKQDEKETAITIYCKDGSIRSMKVRGIYNMSTASQLAFDIEGKNFKKVDIKVLN